jgi:hypothetical protein
VIVASFSGLTEENRRTLLLVSKILQNVATGVEFQKEEYMLPFNPFLKEKFEIMKEFYNKAAVSHTFTLIPVLY